jgi:hypothetical protein
VRGFWSTIRQIATGLAGGGEFNGNANREVITVPFLIMSNEQRATGNEQTEPMLAGTFNVPLYAQVMRKMRAGARVQAGRFPTGKC